MSVFLIYIFELTSNMPRPECTCYPKAEAIPVEYEQVHSELHVQELVRSQNDCMHHLSR